MNPRQIQHSTADLRDEVVQLRAQGLSLAQIGKQFGVSKQYIHKLVKQRPDDEVFAASSSRGLPPRQRMFAAGLLAGKSQREAAISAGVASGGADSFAQRTLKSERFRDTFHQMLGRQGLTEESIANTHRAQLEATKTIHATRDGKITDTMEVPDNQARMNAVRIAWQLYERIGNQRAEEDVELATPQFIIITQEKRKKLEALCGETLDCVPLDDDRVNFRVRAGAEASSQTGDQESSSPEPPDITEGAEDEVSDRP